jgi:hypothetical protein
VPQNKEVKSSAPARAVAFASQTRRINPLLTQRSSDFSFGKTRRINPLLTQRSSDFSFGKTRRIVCQKVTK